MDTATLNALTQTSTTSSSSTSQSAAQAAGQQLAGNFQTFLKLLTTQLQYQDPTSPMDSNQFTQQLVEFAGVEQQINTNSNLEKLVNYSLANSTSSAAGYIGQQVTAGGDSAQLTNGQAHWSYTLGADATDTAITVTDTSGNVVYETKGATSAGPHSFSWDGRKNDGTTAPDGTYKITIKSTDSVGNTVTAATNITGTVSAVDIQNGTVMLKIGGLDVSPGDIITISAPQPSA
jgi:flagellar basal-body rod modification protein FlgD